jgi:hypothetical protein
MQIRKLSRKAGKAVVSVWPPLWASAYKGADKMAVGEVGVLKGVKHLGKRLSLTIEYDGREHIGSLEWDAPPSLEAVESVLKASIGKSIRDIGAVDVR